MRVWFSLALDSIEGGGDGGREDETAVGRRAAQILAGPLAAGPTQGQLPATAPTGQGDGRRSNYCDGRGVGVGRLNRNWMSSLSRKKFAMLTPFP